MTAKPELSTAEFKAALVELVPHLRAFARSLCNDAVLADDLVQDTLLNAWKAKDRFTPTSSFRAWAFTILRNAFYSHKRRSWRSTELNQETAERTLVAPDAPELGMELVAVRHALSHLPDDQREAIILVGAGGMTYEEAAEIVGCALGTIKSRVSRARKNLSDILESGRAIDALDGKSDIQSGNGAFESIINEVGAICHDK